MDKLVFLDTECTGIEEEDRLVQLAYKTDGAVVNELFKPPVPITIEAMAVHHITEKMVADKPSFEDSPEKEKLQAVLDEGILVAHNAEYDVNMLAKEFVTAKNIICTLKVSQHLDENAVIPSHKLQYLRYFLGIEIEAPAHDALGDILVLEKLFARLNQKISIEEMIEVSKRPSLIKRFTFGQYKGQLLKDVVKKDPGYLKWLLKEKEKEEKPNENWLFTLNHYLGI